MNTVDIVRAGFQHDQSVDTEGVSKSWRRDGG